MIVVSSWNCDLMLMLERPLSHYWTSPLKSVIHHAHCERLKSNPIALCHFLMKLILQIFPNPDPSRHLALSSEALLAKWDLTVTLVPLRAVHSFYGQKARSLSFCGWEG